MRIAILGPTDMLHMRRFVSALIDRELDVHVVSMKSEPIAGATFERFSVPKFGMR